jgi:hypothetical protein
MDSKLVLEASKPLLTIVKGQVLDQEVTVSSQPYQQSQRGVRRVCATCQVSSARPRTKLEKDSEHCLKR